MAVVDRNVLRLATAELLACDDVPTAVILNEAVELASAFSTDDSGRFVNGVLATVAARVRPGNHRSGGQPAPVSHPGGPSRVRHWWSASREGDAMRAAGVDRRASSWRR